MRVTEKDRQLARKGFETLRDNDVLNNQIQIKGEAVHKVEPLQRRKSSRRERIRSHAEERVKGREERKLQRNPQSNRALVSLLLGDSAEIELPQSAIKVLTKTLELLSEGKEVIVTGQREEMTTQDAADFLRVSRPFLIGLLEKGEIPFHKVGTHRRIRFSDLQAYKEGIDSQRLTALEELTKQAQELNMGY